MKPATMRRILRPAIPGVGAARFCMYVLPASPDKRPFAGRHAKAVHIRRVHPLSLTWSKIIVQDGVDSVLLVTVEQVEVTAASDTRIPG